MDNDFIKIPVKTYYLEIFSEGKKEFYDDSKLKIVFQENISVDIYLDIYKNVGGNFGWTGRLILEQYLLANLLKSNKSNVYFLYSENKIAGFYELDFSDIENVEITYFGLLPEFYGKGFGTFLINSAKKTAFEKGANRIFLHTCEFDSDGALNFYIKSGFSVYQETVDYEYYTQDFINRNVNLSK